jgi:hypothetical protein
MSKNKTKRQEKILQREKAKRQAKRRKILIICVCALVAAVLLAFAVLAMIRNATAETYSDGNQTVRLFSDMTFKADLTHGKSISGSYKILDTDGGTAVLFSSGGREVRGFIENGSLRIPREWEDGCGHGNVLPRR